MLVISWHFKAASMGVYSREEFIAGMQVCHMPASHPCMPASLQRLARVTYDICLSSMPACLLPCKGQREPPVTCLRHMPACLLACIAQRKPPVTCMLHMPAC